MSAAGTIDGKYQIVRQLGEGGMGAVYEAKHLGTGRRVAVKVIVADVLKKGGGVVERFQREARATGEIETQHIAMVLDTGTDGATGNPYLVMEYLSGEDLHELLARTGALPADVALRVIAQATVGIAKAHDAGVVHRDIKPANLFLTRRDGDVVVKVLDFGIAKVKMELGDSNERRDITKTGAVLGSPLYMSPEQARGDKTIDHRTDVWSLGVVLYEALSGRTPHGHIDTIGGLIVAICSQPAPHLQAAAPWVDAQVAAVVHKALALDPAARWQTASELLAAIRELLPNGMALDESMLVGVTDTARLRVQPQLDLALAQTAQLPADVATANTGPIQSARTTGGVSRTDVQPEKARRWAPILAFAAFAMIGVGTFFALRKTPDTPSMGTTSTTSTSVVTSSSRSLSTTKAVALAIVPADATVDIDGVGVRVENGVVLLTGTIGSTHAVSVTAGGRHTTVQVAVTEGGSIPARVELQAATVTPSASSSSVTVTRRTAATTGVTPSSTATGAPTFDRKFQ